MKKIRYGKEIILSEGTNCLGGTEIETGVEVLDAENDELIGVLGSSVGPYGNSTGAFRSCTTTAPLEELGYGF